MQESESSSSGSESDDNALKENTELSSTSDDLSADSEVEKLSEKHAGRKYIWVSTGLKLAFQLGRHYNTLVPVTQGPTLDTFYMWTKVRGSKGKTTRRQVTHYYCTGCHLKVKKDTTGTLSVKGHVPQMTLLTIDEKTFVARNTVETKDPKQHICQPMTESHLEGQGKQRMIRNEIQQGKREAGPKEADVKLEADLNELRKKGKGYYENARTGAVAHKPLLNRRRFERACAAKYPKLTEYNELSDPKNVQWVSTLRGIASAAGDILDGETFLRMNDENLVILGSDYQMTCLVESDYWMADGTFKYAPKGTMQIYRIFGMKQAAGGKYVCLPCVTVLTKKKDKRLYRSLWQNVFESCANAAKQEGLLWETKACFFDCEEASWGQFKKEAKKAGVS